MSATAHPLELLVRDLELRSPLSARDRSSILNLPVTTQTSEARSYVVREGDVPTQCGILVRGFAFRQKLTSDGERQIVAIILPGEALDFQHLFLRVADHSVQMMTRGEVAFVPQNDLQALMQSSPAINRAVLMKAMVEASIFREWVLNVGRRSARARIAHVLCELGVRLDRVGLARDYGYHLPMTQEELADAVGLTPVHVNRTLMALEAENLVSRTRRQISFPDWQQLRIIADFNEHYLHLKGQPTSSAGG